MPARAIRHCLSCHKLVDKVKHETYFQSMNYDADLDAKGLLCPLPVLKARKRLQALTSGQTLRLLADDPAAIIDIPHFCAESGHLLVSTDETNDGQVYFIKKA